MPNKTKVIIDSDTIDFGTAKDLNMVESRLSEIMADIRERALLQFFNEFAHKKISNLNRKGRRELERWLDKNEVKFQDSSDGYDFIVMIPTRSEAMYCNIAVSTDDAEVTYEFTRVHKRELGGKQES